MKNTVSNMAAKEEKASSSEGEERVEKNGEDSAIAGSHAHEERISPEETDLASCPFCGDEAILMLSGILGPQGPEFLVTCVHCGSRTEQVKTRKIALERWNRRVEGSGVGTDAASTADGSNLNPSTKGVSEVGQAEKEKAQDFANAPTQGPQGKQPEEVRGNAL